MRSVLVISSVAVRLILGHLLHVNGNTAVPARSARIQYITNWICDKFAIFAAWFYRICFWLLKRFFNGPEVDPKDLDSKGIMCFVCVFFFWRRRGSDSERFYYDYFPSTAHVIPGIFLVCIPLVSESPYWCIAFMVLSYGFSGAGAMGGFVNLQEIAPNYATTVMGVVTSFTNWNGFLAPMLVAHFTRDNVMMGVFFFFFILNRQFLFYIEHNRRVEFDLSNWCHYLCCTGSGFHGVR